MIIALLAGAALATPSFDPTAPAERFEGEETYDYTGELQLWNAIERIEDPDDTLFTQEQFNGATQWQHEVWAPFIPDCFGSDSPSSGTALLHMGTKEPFAEGTPVLFVPGVADNGSRGFIIMAIQMDRAWRPAYALTFAHPHGDVFQQAEVVANAIARIKERTGASQVDVVSHSKGGIATAVYLSNHAGAEWGRDDYDSVGTEYRGDVRRAVFIATPLGGADTSYRWPQGNLAGLDADTAIAPTSWNTWYPYSVSTWWTSTDLSDQDFHAADGDLFPGQRQLLRRWDDVYALPGESPWLGTYALQTDWYTSYHGGTGYYSESEGIDAAIAEGDDVLGTLTANGVDPAVELFLLAGNNPLLPNGSENYMAEFFGELWIDLATSGSDVWGTLWAQAVSATGWELDLAEGELQGLAQGKLMLGEVSGPSDGLVFVESAVMADTLTGRGAEVVETRIVDLSHLGLLAASPAVGELAIEQAELDPIENGWMEAVGERYIEADTVGWVETVLADPDDGGGSDTGPDGGDDTGPAGDGGEADDGGAVGEPDDGKDFDGRGGGMKGGCYGCSGSTGSAALILPMLLGLRRRRRR